MKIIDSETITERLRNKELNDEKEIHQDYCNWKKNRMPSKLKTKPIPTRKNWIKRRIQNIFSLLRF